MDTEATLGIETAQLPDILSPVDPVYNAKPVDAFDLTDAIGPHARAYVQGRWGATARVFDIAHNLPYKALQRLSEDELCKLRHSLIFMMDESVRTRFTTIPHLQIIRKIGNSVWRWSPCRDTPWNDLVDAYNGVRSIDASDAGLTTMLDFTRGYNPCGYSEFNGIFLDGVFGLILIKDGRHVMTVGFSFTRDRCMLIQQIQLVSPKGNRWLYKLPCGYVEWVVRMMRTAFPGFTLKIIDGHDVAMKNFTDIKAAEAREREWLSKDNSWAGDSLIQKTRDAVESLHQHAESLKNSLDRIDRLYKDVGAYRLGPACRYRDLRHYELVLS